MLEDLNIDYQKTRADAFLSFFFNLSIFKVKWVNARHQDFKEYMWQEKVTKDVSQGVFGLILNFTFPTPCFNWDLCNWWYLVYGKRDPRELH